jgi:uncharacterized protein (DUF433 family)
VGEGKYLILESFVNLVMVNPEMYIEINPKVMMGKPEIKGTRITVEQLAGGRSIEALLENYPSLSKEAIYAALQFAANNLRADYVFPIVS